MVEGEPGAPRPGVRAGIARLTFLGFRADVVNAAAMVITSIVVARGLGPTDRGVFFLVFLGATLIALLADCGLSVTSIVYGANREIPARQLHGTAVVSSVVAAAVATALLLPFEGFWTDGVLQGLDDSLLLMLALGILPVLYAQIIGALLTGMGHVPEVSGLRLAQAILYVTLISPAALTGDPHWAVAAWLATVTAYAAGLAFYAGRFSGRPAVPAAGTLRQIVSFGGRSYLGSLAQQGFLRVDVLFLSARYGPAVVGVYSLAAIISEKIGLVGHAMYGASAETVGRGGPEAVALIALTLRLLLTMLVPVAIVLGLLSGPGFPLVFGEGFDSAALPFVILLPGTIAIVCWTFVSLFIISALRRPGTTTLIQGGALLVSLPLYYLAVDAWEMTGAATVSSAIYLAVLGAGVAVVLRNTELRLRDLIPRAGEPARLIALLRTSVSRGAQA